MKVTVSFLNTLEEQIRANTAPNLEQFLRPEIQVPRSLTARYANLIRRMGGTKHALAILNPIVRNDFDKPSIEESIEYASCLCRHGLVEESINLLNSIINESYPEIYYELAIAYISKWDYPSSIPYLIKYLSFKNLSSYKICVGEVNLAAAYIYTNENEKAESLLKKLITKLQKNGFNLLCGNALELLGEIYLSKGELDHAMKLFNESGEKLQSSNPRYQLYLEKWKVIIKMLKENGSPESLQECDGLRKKAAALHDWNSLREIELYKAVVTKNTEAILNLYYGVASAEYRKRILLIWRAPLPIEEYYDRKIGPGAALATKVFDIAAGKDLQTEAQLKPGQGMHRLLQALTSDFYAPFLTTKIFSHVFKDVFYNPATSPQQVHQVVNRLNDWFVENKIPLTVKHSKAGYRLRAEQAYILRIQMDKAPRTKNDDFIHLLKSNGLVKDFSVKMVIERLNISRRSVTRLLSEGVASGKLIRRGRSQSTMYSII